MGVVEFDNQDDLDLAIRKLDDTEFRNPFDSAYIRIRDESDAGKRDRSRSRCVQPSPQQVGLGHLHPGQPHEGVQHGTVVAAPRASWPAHCSHPQRSAASVLRPASCRGRSYSRSRSRTPYSRSRSPRSKSRSPRWACPACLPPCCSQRCSHVQPCHPSQSFVHGCKRADAVGTAARPCVKARTLAAYASMGQTPACAVQLMNADWAGKVL